MNNYTVYMHTTPSNKHYIGITSKNVFDRWKNGQGYHNNKHFYNAIMKYGWDNIKHETIVSGVSREWAIKLEQSLILYYRSNENAYGYNHAVGGPNNKSGYHFNHSEETKHLISQSKLGVKFSDAHIQGIKRGWIGRKLRNNGVPWNKGLKLKDTGCIDNFIQAGKSNAVKMRKPIEQIDLTTGEVINQFDSISSAMYSLNKNYVSSIIDVLKGRRKSAFGYAWKYRNDETE